MERTMRNLTLQQALQYNKAFKKQSSLQIKNWYKQGYFLKANYRWCVQVTATRSARKYSTS
jgi:DNA-binding winged helix-turn-helix (wHTH) protein